VQCLTTKANKNLKKLGNPFTWSARIYLSHLLGKHNLFNLCELAALHGKYYHHNLTIIFWVIFM